MANVASRLDRVLKMAGVPIIGVSVGDDGNKATWVVQFAAGATAQDEADAAQLIAVFDPEAGTGERVVTRRGFARLFTQAERIAIRTAAGANSTLADFYELMTLDDTVNLDHPDAIAGIQGLVAAELLTSERATAILANDLPE